MTDTTMVANETTGGLKGQKPNQLHHLYLPALLGVGAVAAQAVDSGKYPAYNYRRGLAFSLGFDALVRHLFAWWEGQDIDPESGLPHLHHVGWHAQSLCAQVDANLQNPSLGLDDRPGSTLAPVETTETPPIVIEMVLDETNKRDRFDCDGDRWIWDTATNTWSLTNPFGGCTTGQLNNDYGPLSFAPLEKED